MSRKVLELSKSHVAKSPVFKALISRIPGNDTSHWNLPTIQWGTAQFTWIKATQGVTYNGMADYMVIRNQAKAKNILCGAYHFFDESDPMAQAKYFVEHVAGNTDIGYALDWEQFPGLVNQALVFLNEVYALTGMLPVLYSYLGFLEEIGPTALAPFVKYPLWLADLSNGGPHIPPPFKQLMFWQYAFGEGAAPDLDVFYGDINALKGLMKK